MSAPKRIDSIARGFITGTESRHQKLDDHVKECERDYQEAVSSAAVGTKCGNIPEWHRLQEAKRRRSEHVIKQITLGEPSPFGKVLAEFSAPKKALDIRMGTDHESRMVADLLNERASAFEYLGEPARSAVRRIVRDYDKLRRELNEALRKNVDLDNKFRSSVKKRADLNLENAYLRKSNAQLHMLVDELSGGDDL